MLRLLSNSSSADAGPPITSRAAFAALLAIALFGGVACLGTSSDDLFCDAPGCAVSHDEWRRLASLAGLGKPASDPSNAVWDNPAAILLGQKFFSDARFSGPATQVDALGRASVPARAPKGQATNVSCATCHDAARGIDTTSIPNNVSAGAGWTDVNALSTINAVFQRRFFWNGRADSVWALGAAVGESATTMNGNRLQTYWVIADHYRSEYEAIFGGLPAGSSAEVAALVESSGERAGQCTLYAGGCLAPCVWRPSSVPVAGAPVGCWPPIPLKGKAGKKSGCQPGDPGEPFGDAFECMSPSDQDLVTRVLVNWAKALAAYQARLISGDSPFDQFVAEGANAAASSTTISAAAKRGARLFVGKAGCIDCHNTPLLSDGDFHNVGVPQSGPGVPTLADCPADNNACNCVAGDKCLPWGAWDGAMRLQISRFRRDSVWSDSKDSPAPPASPPPETWKGAWRTPSLRNVAITAPYMHDGVFATLDQAVMHYVQGPSPDAVGTPAPEIRPLPLTPAEVGELVEFLKTLTGDPPHDPALSVSASLGPDNQPRNPQTGSEPPAMGSVQPSWTSPDNQPRNPQTGSEPPAMGSVQPSWTSPDAQPRNPRPFDFMVDDVTLY